MAFASIVPDLYPNDCNCLLNLWIGCKFRKIFSCLMLHNHPVGMADGSRIYIVPMNFGYEFEGDSLILYFHGAGEGRKLELIRKNPEVGIPYSLLPSYSLSSADGNHPATDKVRPSTLPPPLPPPCLPYPRY